MPCYQRAVAPSLTVDDTRGAAQNRRHFAGSYPPLAVSLVSEGRVMNTLLSAVSVIVCVLAISAGVMLDVRHKPSDEAKRVYTAERVNEILRRNTKQS